MQIYQEARSSSVYINGRNHWWAVRICVALVYCILTNSGTDNRYHIRDNKFSFLCRYSTEKHRPCSNCSNARYRLFSWQNLYVIFTARRYA